MVDCVLSAPQFNVPTPTGTTASLSNIPICPKKEDYPDVKFWEQASWQVIRSGHEEHTPGSPTISIFLEDEFGNPIPPGIKKAIRDDVHSYWNECSPQELGNWSDIGLTTKEAFRTKFEGAYPWLRLCEGHWKVDHMWINYFSKWKNSYHPSPTNILLDSRTSNISVGSKRGHEEPEDSDRDSPKRLKGKEREIPPSIGNLPRKWTFTPTRFIHSRAPRKKALARLGKVMQSLPICSYYY